ncbi:glutathione S-transferase family protein [Kovacikia minuta CCNUW1]|uniref:glutathione S-transferase family protein n=1 Tax=Kovacikia minuta TaxID=2931930 RepID=UPI001CCCEF4C|nr:glutathione S-transferase family protein [Kovacikia minuta]UBF25550.1 glutathione S-transferase family protein [Kovacikia minuta CCNUW1]
MLKLYGGERSRASIVRWYLEELGVPYEFVVLDMSAGEHRQPAYLSINPAGKVPAITDGDFKLWESGAILLYLAEKYSKPAPSLEQRSILNQWILFANATLGPGVFGQENRDREMPRLMTMLNQLFDHQPFVLGEAFSAADVAVGSLLTFIPVMLQVDLSAYPSVLNYMQRISERPAFQAAIGGRRSSP